MGWPLDWTALTPLETANVQRWRRRCLPRCGEALLVRNEIREERVKRNEAEKE